ncbi:class III extradiol ring-cleavage dioxygenase [Paenibacillus sp. YYML68]|uniref:DODA-type extradiol aromatic ring-opening family dioxygenase n=1 Tax=Paenibacillus sp. YYML68 TaxID=2909250 RepID=UPI0024932C6A|nr:class III extradiol ring-cleavage dioxygenase [Paenibacillus sp. YYML68]
MLPTIFVAHGLPTLAMEHSRYTSMLQTLGATLPRPDAIVIISAHWQTIRPHVGAPIRFRAIHDYFGYPEELYRLEYEASGDIALALQINKQLELEGIHAELDDERGLDHGAWSVLKWMYPRGDVPIVSMSVCPSRVPEEHYRIGRAIAALRQRNVLVIGSGGTVHNLEQLAWSDETVTSWALTFDQWLQDRLETWDIDRLFHYQDEAPCAAEAMPTRDHLAPLLIAMGAAHEGKKAKLLHRQYQNGCLSLSCWMFG